MNKISTSILASLITIVLLTSIILSPILASEDNSDDTFGTEDECAKKYNPYYDRERYLGCTGGIGTPKIK
ncbi:MAG: hypothetical protein MRJ93_04770 [Nitrososphaeraceae archaeon]|nr:hypothetical protein [Nitrososphaeraceae archaeon]